MCDGVPERKSSIFADEGTAAHMLAEACMSKGYRARHLVGRVIDINGKDFATQFLMPGAPLVDGRFEVDTEMAEGVQLFLDTVAEAYDEAAGDVLRVEHRVNFSGDEEFGTADAVVFKAKEHRVKVFDLKYGAGVLVEVKDAAGRPNKQLVCYGEGSVREFIDDQEIEAIDITIVQPRMPHPDGPVRSVEIDALELLDWSFSIDAAVAATHDPAAPLVAGEWCKWCPAEAVCPKATTTALAVAQQDFDNLDVVNLPAPEQLSIQQVARILDGLDYLEGWAKNVRAYAYGQAEAGTKVPGHKIVAKVARRQWRGEEQDIVAAIAGMGVAADDMLNIKLKSPAQIEKLVGKKDFKAKLADLAPSISSGTVLVPESDKRPEVSRAIEDHFDDLDLA